MATNIPQPNVDADSNTVPAVVADMISTAANYAKPDEVHAAFTWLRANHPVARINAAGYMPYWSITKHADILEVERNDAIFRNTGLPLFLRPAALNEAIESSSKSADRREAGRGIVSLDGEEHRKFRAVAQGWFMPVNLKKLEGRIREIAQRHVAHFLSFEGRCDFHADVGLHYPMQVIMEIMGMPIEEEPRMLKLTQELFGNRDPEMRRQGNEPEDPARAAAIFQAINRDFDEYFGQLTAERRSCPREDVASVIANAEIDGELISRADANNYFRTLATAGHDTTSASTAGAVWALATRPDELAKLHANPSLIPSLVEEAIRWVTPVKHFMRTAVEDYELRGQRIKAGDWLHLAYMSGNRDEDVFEEPFEFRVDRSPNKQVAFGYGVHVCLGMHLARLEMRILFEELLPRIKSLALDGEVRWAQSAFVSGPRRVPIRFEAMN